MFFQDLRKSATHVTSILDHFILFVVLQIGYTLNTEQRVQLVTILALEEDGVVKLCGEKCKSLEKVKRFLKYNLTILSNPI